jgi:uncharacterized protein
MLDFVEPYRPSHVLRRIPPVKPFAGARVGHIRYPLGPEVALVASIESYRLRCMTKTALLNYAKDWNWKAITRLLEQDRSLAQVRDDKGWTPLHVCARRRCTDSAQVPASIATARVLLAAGTDINATYEIGEGGEIFLASALWHAITWGRNQSLATFLLESGADPNHCLWAAVWADDARLVSALLKAGPRLEATVDGETPLLYATRLGREAIALQLIYAGANRGAVDRKGKSALDHALKKRLGAGAIKALGGDVAGT